MAKQLLFALALIECILYIASQRTLNGAHPEIEMTAQTINATNNMSG